MIVQFTCANCGNTFEKDVAKGTKAWKYCSEECNKEAAHLRYEWKKKLRAKEKEAKRRSSLRETLRFMDSTGKTYQEIQEAETKEMIKVDVKDRIKEIRKSWGK